MAIKNPLAQRALALLGYGFGVGLRSTLDVRAAYADSRVDHQHPEHPGRTVYAVWHETLLIPVLMLGAPGQVALASDSGDGEIITQVLEHLGWETARGSTSKGGITALLHFLTDDNRSPNLTVDGPRGPRRVMSLGPIFLASHLGLPIVCGGIGMDRPWRLNSWDRFAIPRPYSRVRCICGPFGRVPAGLRRDGLEAYRVWFENQLNWLTMEAETWAESGRRWRGEIPVSPREMSPALPHWDPAHAIRLPDWLQRSWEALPKGRPRAA